MWSIEQEHRSDTKVTQVYVVEQLPQPFKLFTCEDELQIWNCFLHILLFTCGQTGHFPRLETVGRKRGSKYRNYTDSKVQHLCFIRMLSGPWKTEVTALENFQFFANFQLIIDPGSQSGNHSSESSLLSSCTSCPRPWKGRAASLWCTSNQMLPHFTHLSKPRLHGGF